MTNEVAWYIDPAEQLREDWQKVQFTAEKIERLEPRFDTEPALWNLLLAKQEAIVDPEEEFKFEAREGYLAIAPVRGAVPVQPVPKDGKVYVPPFDIACQPSIKLNEYGTNEYLRLVHGIEIEKPDGGRKKTFTTQRAFLRAQDSLTRQCDVEALKVINHSIADSNQITGSFNFKMILDLLLEGGCIVAHPQTFRKLKNLGWNSPLSSTALYTKNEFDGKVCYITTICPKSVIYILPPAEELGVTTSRYTSKTYAYFDNHRFRYNMEGWVSRGFAVLDSIRAFRWVDSQAHLAFAANMGFELNADFDPMDSFDPVI